MKIDIRVLGAKKFQAKTQKISTFVKNEFAGEVIQDAYNWTLKIMPKKTGALKRALSYVKRQKTASLNQRMPTQSRRNPRPYHLWLNSTGNTSYTKRDGTTGTININAFKANIRSGQTDYMKLVAEEIRKRIADKVFKENFK